MKFNMHKASILRKLHSQFPVRSPPAQVKVTSLGTNPPPTYPHQNKAIWIGIFTTFQRTEEKFKTPAPLEVQLSHCGGSHR